MQNNTKSSVVAGILGVFLGAFGGHDWYLGNTKKAITHVSLCVGGVILLMIGLILTNLSRTIPALNVLFICLLIAAYIIIVGNGIWGFIEGIVIIAQGDAGLAAKGYQVAAPAASFMPAPNANPAEATPAEKPVLTAAPVKAEQATTSMEVTPPEAPAKQPAVSTEADINKPTTLATEAGSTTDTAKTPSSAPADEANSAKASAATMDTTPEPGTPVSAPNTILNNTVSAKVQPTSTEAEPKTATPENVAGVVAGAKNAATTKAPAATASATTPTADTPLTSVTANSPAAENPASNTTDSKATADATPTSATVPTAAMNIAGPTANNTDAAIGANTNVAAAPAPASIDATSPAGQSATSTPPANPAA